MKSAVQNIPENLIYEMVDGNPIYYQERTDELLNFGVTKVIWIFTETKKVMVAQREEKWETSNWDRTIHIIGDLSVIISEPLQRRK